MGNTAPATGQELAMPRPGNGLAVASPPQPLFQGFKLLNTYSETGVIERGTPRPPTIATISAGKRPRDTNNKPGNPMVSRDGTIYISEPGKAPGLARILEENSGKRLTITCPTGAPETYIQQHFTEYTATKLKAFGDAESITVVDDKGNRTVHLAGSKEYKEALKKCKAGMSFYFYVARWTQEGARVMFPDGMGYYRLRTSGTRSKSSIIENLDYIASLTGGIVAGIPLELTIDYQEVSDKDGMRRTIPVWQARLHPPHEMEITSENFRLLANQFISTGRALQLPSPPAETWESEIIDVPALDEEEIEVLKGGGPCNSRNYTTAWFRLVRGTQFDSDQGRAAFVSGYTDGATDSLATFLSRATTDQAEAFIEEVEAVLKAEALLNAAPEVVAAPTPTPAAKAPKPAAVTTPAADPAPPAPVPDPVQDMFDSVAALRAWGELQRRGQDLQYPIGNLPEAFSRQQYENWTADVTHRLNQLEAKHERLAQEQTHRVAMEGEPGGIEVPEAELVPDPTPTAAPAPAASSTTPQQTLEGTAPTPPAPKPELIGTAPPPKPAGRRGALAETHEERMNLPHNDVMPTMGYTQFTMACTERNLPWKTPDDRERFANAWQQLSGHLVVVSSMTEPEFEAALKAIEDGRLTWS